MSANDVALAFVNHYYTSLNSNPAALGSLYQPHSTLTWEGSTVQGPAAITEKLLSFGKLTHNIPGLRTDVQVSLTESAMLIFVTGQLMIESNPPINFSQLFQLVATGPGAYYVHNEIFRVSQA